MVVIMVMIIMVIMVIIVIISAHGDDYKTLYALMKLCQMVTIQYPFVSIPLLLQLAIRNHL